MPSWSFLSEISDVSLSKTALKFAVAQGVPLLEALFAQSLDWRSVLHALPETMPVKSMCQVLPTSRNGGRCVSPTARGCTAWHWIFYSLECSESTIGTDMAVVASCRGRTTVLKMARSPR